MIMNMLSVVREVRWLLVTIIVQCAIIFACIIYSVRLQQQGIAQQLWVMNQFAQLQHIRGKISEGNNAAYADAQKHAVQLSQRLEQAQAGQLGMALGETLALALKSWQLPVTGLSELLLQGDVETSKDKITELLARAQSEADNSLSLAGETAEKLSARAYSFRLAGLVFAGLLSLTSLGFVVLMQWRYRRSEKLHAETLENEKARSQMLTQFMEAISAGNYQAELTDINDEALASKLNTMRNKLRSSAETEARRNRAASGLAQIGEILRSTSNSSELYDRIIKFVVTFTKSNQGGLFLHRQDEDGRNQYLELVAAYAFERKKFITKSIDVGQGLVGQCFLEAEKIFITKVPDDYVHITSGLGEANPNCILLVPLKTDERVMGVMELASFSVYDAHEIELIEKFAQSIAATLASVQVNENTRMLLERTQQQAEEMRAQEEEMRQNMEELAATQEEMARKEKEYIRRIQELEEQLQARAATP
jgi:putative methionine-R-sulfoxide reductase with GAF domain